MFAILAFLLVQYLPGLAALIIGLPLRRSGCLERQRYLLPVLGLLICYYCFTWMFLLLIILPLSFPLVLGLWARNRFLVTSGSLLLWIASAFFNFPLSGLVFQPSGQGWSLIGLLIALAVFFLALTPFAWYSWGKSPSQEHD